MYRQNINVTQFGIIVSVSVEQSHWLSQQLLRVVERNRADALEKLVCWVRISLI